MKVEAVIFDMDGTMLDTGNLWIESALSVNKTFGYDKSLEDIKSYIGTGKKDEYCTLVKNVFNEKIINDELKSKEGLYSLLEFLKTKKIKTAVASSSKMEKIKTRFSSAGIDLLYFDKIISGDMVANNKPHPEIYMRACKELGVLPENAIVLEDSDVGVKAATNAKVKAILIPDVVKPNYQTVELAYKVFASLNLVKEYLSWNISEENQESMLSPN